MQRHIVLLGDSIFDNKSYVADGRSVLEHLQEALPKDDKATLLAVDGAVVRSVARQLERIPSSATHLVLSVGGNDALGLASTLFATSCGTVRDGLSQTVAACQVFANEYRQLTSELVGRGLPLTMLTIYDAVPGLGHAERGGLCVFNDIITRTAFEWQANLIDLRLLCRDPADYSSLSPIEPSHQGGRKIASAILQTVRAREDGIAVFASS